MTSARPTLSRSVRARHWLGILLLGVLVGGYFAPQLLGGTTQWDGIDVHYASQRYFADAIHNGELPFWTPYIFSGFPLLADLQTGAWYPLNWPFFLLGMTPNSISGELLLHTLIACLGAYFLARRLFNKQHAAIASGMFYGLSGYFAAHSQHVGMVETAAWLPWLVLLLDSIAERVTAARLAMSGLLGAAVALPGHFQTALYSFAGVATYAALDGLLHRSPRRAVNQAIGLSAAAVWGGLLALVMILPGLELTRQSVRTQLNATDVNLGYFQLDSLLTLVQPDYFGVLLDSRYTGPGDVTQHYFYAGVLLVPLALVGLLHGRARALALTLGLPFVWYALGPNGGLFNLLAELPGFRSVELPMHGWFLPALGLAVLGGAGVMRLSPRFAWPLLLVVFVDVLVFNSLQNRLTFARHTTEELYGAPLRAFRAQVDAADPPVERLYGPPLTAIAYRNHALQSHVETTYGYNPLELAGYADYSDAAEQNPRLVDGFAATHRLGPGNSVQPNLSALPLAYFARSVTAVADDPSAVEQLPELDPARETLVLGAAPEVEPDPAATVTVQDRRSDSLTLRYQSASPQVLRVAIPYFPGWHAAVNSAELPIVRVDRAFIGVAIPPGQGEIRLWYSPRFFWWGAAASSLALLANLTVLGRAWLPLARGITSDAGRAKRRGLRGRSPLRREAPIQST